MEEYRIPLVLYYYSGFRIKVISRQLKMSVNTVKTRIVLDIFLLGII
ncbi:sigma factor-like helix-turn-helix DNA-binding protein [Enterococcus sp. 5H]|nr:sigma factor-like helix-turn-helix DNA-binding protein [Enterococcus sp. 5H]